MAKWIWQFGEMECYHNMLIHGRRWEYDSPEPPMWRIYKPEPMVRFKTTAMTPGGSVRLRVCGEYIVNLIRDDAAENREIRSGNCGEFQEIDILPGKTKILVTVYNRETFPSIYMEGVIETGEDWLADNRDMCYARVGSSPLFQDGDRSPETFPFCYSKLPYVKKEHCNGGVLFDFGKETFARLRVSMIEDEKILVSLGESREEALDAKWSMIRFTLSDCRKQSAGDGLERRPRKLWNMEQEPAFQDGAVCLPAYAFRYLYVSDAHAEAEAEYEYLPLENRASFSCDEELVNRIWDMAALTVHLNSREFFLDGIKRDRWVWAGDAWQTLFVNHYLFFDQEVEKRTLTALGGKKPFTMHINAIMDYTFFWIMSLWEYYVTYGDTDYLGQIYPQLEEVMRFCMGRRSADGFMRQNPGDWIFIDWADMDKTGALFGEQVLFARAMECYGEILEVLAGTEYCSLPEEIPAFSGEELHRKAAEYREEVGHLRKKIMDLFYDGEKKAFIDSYESGKRNVTRHNNLLAYLYLPMPAERKTEIYQNVILNEEVAPITTPYFKFFENQVHCEEGNSTLLEESLRNYYGSMLATGATTLYEQFDPEKQGTEHYEMYGKPFGKSLCHAWSASPVYLLGRYRLGVKNTGIAYDSFEVQPNPGDFREFSGTVPLPHGEVRVKWKQGIPWKKGIPDGENHIQVTATVQGGTLVWEGKRYELPVGETVTCVS